MHAINARTGCAGRAHAGPSSNASLRTPSYRFQSRSAHSTWRASASIRSADIVGESDRSKIDELERRFRMADNDGNGRIDRDELRMLLESTDEGGSYLLSQHWLPEQELDAAMAKYDKDASGDITFDEFQRLIYDGILLDGKLSEYEQAFAAIDTSGNGTIGATEIAALFQQLGQSMSYERLVEVFQRYDLDQSGQIEFNEFLLMFRDQLLDLRSVLDYVTKDAPSSVGRADAALIDVAETDVALIFSEAELDELLAAAGSARLVVLFCGLTWCRPCKGMQRPFQRMAQHYPQLACIKLFGNANDQTKRLFKDRLRVRSTPSFIFFANGEQVGSSVGANKEKLEVALREAGAAAGITMPEVGVYVANEVAA